jgi:hypothetical protein
LESVLSNVLLESDKFASTLIDDMVVNKDDGVFEPTSIDKPSVIAAEPVADVDVPVRGVIAPGGCVVAPGADIVAELGDSMFSVILVAENPEPDIREPSVTLDVAVPSGIGVPPGDTRVEKAIKVVALLVPDDISSVLAVVLPENTGTLDELGTIEDTYLTLMGEVDETVPFEPNRDEVLVPGVLAKELVSVVEFTAFN